MGSRTPWGTSDHSVKIEQGVTFYITPSHGGLKVSPSKVHKLSAAAQAVGWDAFGDGALWYEEDVAVNVPLYDVPAWAAAARGGKEVSAEERDQLAQSLQRWYPEYWAQRGHHHLQAKLFNPDEPEGEYIDVTPTWEGIIWEMLRILPHTTREGRDEIYGEILRAARLADKWVAYVESQEGE